MKNDIRITVVIKTTESNDLKQPHAVQVEKQVDLDKGSKLTRLGAYLPFVIGLIELIREIADKF
jgi:hypothetical protein